MEALSMLQQMCKTLTIMWLTLAVLKICLLSFALCALFFAFISFILMWADKGDTGRGEKGTS